jgi:hypothetical protein
MYEELVKRLRSQCQGYGKECEDCNADGNGRSQMENEAADAIEALSKTEKTTCWIPVTDKEHIPNTDHGVVGYFGGGAFNQLRWYDFVTTLSDGKIVGESTERDVINEHCIAVYKLPEPPKEE